MSRSISHPGPPEAYGLEAKEVPRLPRLGFPPWNPSSEAPPPLKESPRGDTHPPRPVISASLSLGAVVVLGEDRATHGPRVAPTGSRPLQIPPLRPSHPSPRRGLPLLEEVAAYGRVKSVSRTTGPQWLRARRGSFFHLLVVVLSEELLSEPKCFVVRLLTWGFQQYKVVRTSHLSGLPCRDAQCFVCSKVVLSQDRHG